LRPLTPDEIVDRASYEALRPAYRERVITHKRRRRVAVGEKVTLLFEDRETLRFQIQEMLWVERSEAPAKIEHEVEVYNQLIPAAGELSATLFIEITQSDQIRSELSRLVGIDEHVHLVLGEGGDERVVTARFDSAQMEEDRISAVHYLRFALDADDIRALANRSLRARLRIDHPNYSREVDLDEALRQSLLDDLTREPEPLLRAEDVAAARPPPADEVLATVGRVRLVRPAQPRTPGHLIVEPVDSYATFLTLDPKLEAELLAQVREVAREFTAHHHSTRITTDLGNADERIRWHIYPLPD